MLDSLVGTMVEARTIILFYLRPSPSPVWESRDVERSGHNSHLKPLTAKVTVCIIPGPQVWWLQALLWGRLDPEPLEVGGREGMGRFSDFPVSPPQVLRRLAVHPILLHRLHTLPLLHVRDAGGPHHCMGSHFPAMSSWPHITWTSSPSFDTHTHRERLATLTCF